MSAPSPPDRASLRKLLAVILTTAADFEAFCLDFFPDVAAQFAGGQNRVDRDNLLLQYAEVEQVLLALKQHSPRQFARYRKMMRRRQATPGAVARNPYRGLSAFEVEEADLFYGRDELTEKLWERFRELYDRVGATRVLAILGPSGSGKSSVAKAGLLSELLTSPVPGPAPVRTIVLKPGGHPLGALAIALQPPDKKPPTARDLSAQRALADYLRQPNGSGKLDGLSQWVANWPSASASPFVLLVDQFEEIYTLCSDKKERDVFVDVLLHAASDRARHVSVVLTLRSDFLGETHRQHPELNRLIGGQAIIVTAMSRAELSSAISEPAAQAGRPLDDATVQLLIAQSSESAGALPLLEFALTQIWEAMQAGEEPGETLCKIGGVGGALASEAQKIYGSLRASEQAMARRALVRLVQLGDGTRDTRKRVPVLDLCGSGETEAEMLVVLRKFASESARLLTLSGDGAAAVAEVTHEALFDHWSELRGFVDECRLDRRLHDRATEAARLWNEDKRPGRLWRRPDLDLLRDYRKRKPEELSPLQLAFLQAAETQWQRERILAWGAVAVIFLAVIIAAGVYITKEQQRAGEEQRRTREAAEAGERIRQQLLDTDVEQGRYLLLEKGLPTEALLWLNRAQARHSTNSTLPDLLRGARYGVEATRTVLVGHGERIINAKFSPDGKRIVTASGDQTARVWDAETGHQILKLEGHEETVWSARYSPDGKRIVTASSDDTARIWDAESGRQVARFKGHAGNVWSAKYGPDGKRIVTASEDGTARIWDAGSGHQVAVLPGQNSHGSDDGANFSPDARHIVTAGEDHMASVWDAETGRLVSVINDKGRHAETANFSPDGKYILTTERWGRTAVVWDAETGRQRVTLRGHEYELVGARYSPDGRRIVTAGRDHTARVWNAETGSQIVMLLGHEDSVLSARFSPDGKHIVTASWDRTVRVWDSATGRQILEIEGHGSSVNNAEYSPDGKRIVTASDDKTARIAGGAEPLRQIAVVERNRDSVRSANFSRDGKRIITRHRSDSVLVWDAETGRWLTELKSPTPCNLSAEYSPDGRRCVTTSRDHTAHVWDVASGRQLVAFTGHGDVISSASFSPDGKRIVTASADMTFRVWDAETGREVTAFTQHGNVVNTATYSPDGRRIVTASADDTARVWDAETGQKVALLKGHTDDVLSAAYSPDGMHIVTASEDNTAGIWDAETGQKVVMLKGHEHAVRRAEYSPDGKRIVTASEDNTARVWDAEMGRQLVILKGHGKSVTSATYSPDGTRILTTSEDSTARIWDVAPETKNADEIAKLIRCKVGARFEREDRNLIIPIQPSPSECLPSLRSHP